MRPWTAPATVRRMTEPTRRRVHPVILAVVGVLVGAAAGAGITVALRPPAKAGAVNTVYVTSTVTAAVPTAATAPTAGGPRVLALGTTTAVNGAKVTVYSYRQPTAASAPAPVPAGYVWGAADVKVCATELDTVSTIPWTLQYADDTQAEPSNDIYNQFPAPEYPVEKTLQPGRCARGWIVFPVPKAKKPTMVEYQLDTGETRDWKV